MVRLKWRVSASRIANAVRPVNAADLVKARDIAWRKIETAKSDSAYAAAVAEYAALN
jgi:hypothetical protein